MTVDLSTLDGVRSLFADLKQAAGRQMAAEGALPAEWWMLTTRDFETAEAHPGGEVRIARLPAVAFPTMWNEPGMARRMRAIYGRTPACPPCQNPS